MIIKDQQDVTIAAIAAMQKTSDPRLREIMVSLVRHLHGFIRDVRLTEVLVSEIFEGSPIRCRERPLYGRHEDVNDWLCRRTRDRRAAKVLHFSESRAQSAR